MSDTPFLRQIRLGNLRPRFRMGELALASPRDESSSYVKFDPQPCVVIGFALFDDSPDGRRYLAYEVFLQRDWHRRFDRKNFVSVIDEQLEVLWPQDLK